MQHLTLEALARLVDEPPDRAEAEHLEGCAACREELDALRRQGAALAALGQAPAPEPPEEHWDAILAGLAAGPAGTLTLPSGRRRAVWRAPWFRIAAAIAIYAVGTATGLELGGRLLPRTAAPATQGRAVAGHPDDAPGNVEGTLASRPTPDLAGPEAGAMAPETVRIPDAGRLTSTAEGAGRLRRLPDAADATTPDEALRAIRDAERAYAQAYSRYSELTGGAQADDDPIARLAALESIVLTTRQALDRAPADPVINGYHLSAVAQRDAALRQIALRSNGRWF